MTKTADELRGESYLDSRDIIEAANEIRSEIEEDPRDLEDDEQALLDFVDDGPYGGDWEHGASMIREDYFIEYAQELAEDIGAIGRDLPWPACHIDWDAAADALKQDYETVDFLGYTYYVR